MIDHALGYFVDQRWFDLVPSIFDRTSVLRDPGANVAYWNLHERTLSRSPDGSWLVNGTPLRFFHFSGFDPDNPQLLSRHQTRTRLSERPELAQLCEGYALDVRADRRAGDEVGTYAWGTLGDGRQLSRRLRRLYREGERESAFNRSPFEADGADEFLAWLNEPAPGDPAPLPVSRFWFDVYKERKDLQVVFPKLIDEVEAFNRWIEGFGEEMGDIRGLTPRGNEDQTHGEPETPTRPWTRTSRGESSRRVPAVRTRYRRGRARPHRRPGRCAHPGPPGAWRVASEQPSGPLLRHGCNGRCGIPDEHRVCQRRRP